MTSLLSLAIIAATTMFLIALFVFAYVVYAYGFDKPRPSSGAIVEVEDDSRADTKTSTEDGDHKGDGDDQQISSPHHHGRTKAKNSETINASKVAPIVPAASAAVSSGLYSTCVSFPLNSFLHGICGRHNFLCL